MYDDISKTLREKYQLESKIKLQEITSKLKKAFEEKVSSVETQSQAKLQKEKANNAKLELKIVQLANELEEIKCNKKELEIAVKESKEKQDLSF